jgi:hypothetical protein
VTHFVKIKALPLDRHAAGRMNKTESSFAAYLLGCQCNHLIKRFDFEPEKFRLAELTFYTPDFRIVELDDTITFLDVKATVSGKPFYKDDSIVKIKTSAAMHPMYRFGITWKIKSGAWETREY